MRVRSRRSPRPAESSPTGAPSFSPGHHDAVRDFRGVDPRVAGGYDGAELHVRQSPVIMEETRRRLRAIRRRNPLPQRGRKPAGQRRGAQPGRERLLRHHGVHRDASGKPDTLTIGGLILDQDVTALGIVGPFVYASHANNLATLRFSRLPSRRGGMRAVPTASWRPTS